MRILTCLAAALLLSACGTTPSETPTGAMFSAEAALKVVFDEVCAPAILEGKSVETLARAKSMIEVDATGLNARKDDREWRLATIGYASVMAWADGTCMISVEQGEPASHRAHLLSSIAARGIKLARGKTISANGGANTAYCTADAQPLVLGIITPAPGGARRTAIVANLFRAKDAKPDFCQAST
jgi:hypothetical protein